MFKRIKAWVASWKRSPKEKPYTLDPAYSVGYNGSGKDIRPGMMVSKKRMIYIEDPYGDVEGEIVSILPCVHVKDEGGFIRRFWARLGGFNPHASPPIGIAIEDIPKGKVGRIQIAGIARIPAIPSDDTAV